MVKCLVCYVRDPMTNQFLLNLKKNTHILDRVERKNQERKTQELKFLKIEGKIFWYEFTITIT